MAAELSFGLVCNTNVLVSLVYFFLCFVVLAASDEQLKQRGPRVALIMGLKKPFSARKKFTFCKEKVKSFLSRQKVNVIHF